MARDKSKDDKYFNCNQEYELNYVAGLYVNRDIVKNFLKESCANNTIYHSTHAQVYKLIRDKLGYPIPD